MHRGLNMVLLAITFVLTILSLYCADLSSSQTSINVDNSQANPVVSIKQGQIQGISLESTNGTDFFAFLGIPYGTARRFQAPEPSESWDGILDATEDAPVCLQFDEHGLFDIIGAENCLSLNVYTPKLPDFPEKADLLPVMVFINGGVFQEEDASSSMYGPQRLLNYPIVLVVMNYRVGPFGFLSTGDGVASGNYGHLDQLLALKWVKENIATFGGDPNKVTLSGQSSGGASVLYHMLSPQSKGLFRSAISQSGTALCSWSLQENPLNVALTIGKKLKCPTASTKVLMKCLENADAAAIITAANQSNMYFLIRNAPLPVIEKSSVRSFLSESPYRLLKEGRFNKVPIITGVTKDEGTFLLNDPRIFEFIRGPKEVFQKKFPEFIHFLLDFPIEDGNVTEVIYNEYFKDVDFENFDDVLTTSIELVSDAIFNGCNDLTIRFLSAGGVPVYSYVYDYIGDDKMRSNYTGKPDVDHGAELFYLFDSDVFGNLTFSHEEEKFSDGFLDLWINFIETNNPTPSGPLKWLPSQPEQYKYLRISQNMIMEEGYRKEKMKFWRDILVKHYNAIDELL